MTPDEIQDHDKRRVAYHEAGHAVTAWHLGSSIQRVQITAGNYKDLLEESAWEGSAIYSRNTAADSVIAWAGPIAERMLAGEWEEDSWADFETSEFSDTDLAGIESGSSWAEDSIRAFNILTEHWSLVAAVAERLIAHEVLTNWQFYQLTAADPP